MYVHNALSALSLSLLPPFSVAHTPYNMQRLTADTGFSLGALCRPPDPHKADKLGSGGNGSVFGYFQNGRQFAVKKV